MSLLSEVEWKMQFSRPDLLQLLSYSFILYESSIEKTVVLLCDDHGSHLTQQTIRRAMEYEVIIIVSPPYTSRPCNL